VPAVQVDQTCTPAGGCFNWSARAGAIGPLPVQPGDVLPVGEHTAEFPELDHRLDTASMRAFVDTPVWHRPNAERSWRLYLGPEPGEVSPYASPSIAADLGDRATVATTFALSNGVFARIFPLAPAPLIFAGIGFALAGSGVLRPAFGRSALLVAALFVLSGIAAVFGTPGLIFAIVMSILEAIWIATTAVALAVSRPPASS